MDGNQFIDFRIVRFFASKSKEFYAIYLCLWPWSWRKFWQAQILDHYNFELSSVFIKCLCCNLCLVHDSYSLPGKKNHRMCLNSFYTTVNSFNHASMNNKTFELISWENTFAFLFYTFCKNLPFTDLPILCLLKHIW